MIYGFNVLDGNLPQLFPLFFVVMPFLPESPRRMVIVGKPDQAKAALRRVYGDSVSDKFLDREIATIQEEVELTRSSTYKDFKKRENYHPLFIGMYVITSIYVYLYV